MILNWEFENYNRRVQTNNLLPIGNFVIRQINVFKLILIDIKKNSGIESRTNFIKKNTNSRAPL